MKFLLTGLALAANCVSAHGPLHSLSSADVQNLLTEWRLDRVYGDNFVEDQVDGAALSHMIADELSGVAYPRAKPFHARKLIEFRDTLAKSLSPSQKVNSPRRLSTGPAGSGITIARVCLFVFFWKGTSTQHCHKLNCDATHSPSEN